MDNAVIRDNDPMVEDSCKPTFWVVIRKLLSDGDGQDRVRAIRLCQWTINGGSLTSIGEKFNIPGNTIGTDVRRNVLATFHEEVPRLAACWATHVGYMKTAAKLGPGVLASSPCFIVDPV